MNKKNKKQLKPIEPKDSWSVGLQKELEKTIKEILYQPLLNAEKEILPATNASTQNPIIQALARGTLNYSQGLFTAVKWNAHLTRELKKLGATWVSKRAAFSLPLVRMPKDLAMAVRGSRVATETLYTEFLKRIDEMPKKMVEAISLKDLSKYSNKVATKTDGAFKKTVLKTMAVQPDLAPEQQIRFDENYVQTTTLPIRKTLDKKFKENIDGSMNNFSDEETIKLREIVSEYVRNGRPRAELIALIQGRLHVGDSRAKFIARQETALYTAKFKQAQYQSSGIKKYRWMTVGDEKVRTLHRKHHRRTYYWSDPPVAYENGKKGHPGEAFNCRCTASPIVEW